MISDFIKWTRLLRYRLFGRKPWSAGYNEFRWRFIQENIDNKSTLDKFNSKQLPKGYGVGLDDRVVEYPWIFEKLNRGKGRMLDAGSTFNFPELIDRPEIKEKDFTIYTYYPEKYNFSANRISYCYGDLREMPFLSNWFETIVCQSTIEHIGMNNSIYGYGITGEGQSVKKDYSHQEAVKELMRQLKPGGQLLLTFPYGKFENHGFFQQFDREMLAGIETLLDQSGKYTKTFFLYSETGWQFADQSKCDDAVSFNPHSGMGKGNDGAAHCRCICCIEWHKNA